MASTGTIQMRSGIRRLFSLVQSTRQIALVARRQYGKTTGFAQLALYKMMRNPDHTIIFGSAKLNLSREIVRKEASIMESAIRAAIASSQAGQITIANADTAQPLDAAGLTTDDFADLYEHSRLEFRYMHSRTSYSRTKVVALRADTVGETGDLMLDEVGRVSGWQDVWEAVEPIIASNPDFRLLISTTPPPDSAHYSYEMLAPPPGSTFNPAPAGNLYRSIGGLQVLRVDAWDAQADNIPLYDSETGSPLTPEESRSRSRDKDAWDRNYACAFIEAGTAAIPWSVIAEAMHAGRDTCVFCDDDLPPAWRHLFNGASDIAIGYDIATTTRDTSNPSVITIMCRGPQRIEARLIIRFKTADPKRPLELLTEIVETLTVGNVGIDATSERYFAAIAAEALEPRANCLLIVASETCPDAPEKVNFKSYTGTNFVNAMLDGEIALPDNIAVRDDLRLARRYKGGIDNALDSTSGAHGDIFDSLKLAYFALNTEVAKTDAHAINLLPSSQQHSTSRNRLPLRPDHTSDHMQTKHLYV